MSYYDDLKESLEQAIAFKNGDKSKGRAIVREIPTPDYNAEDVQRIRDELKLSQNSLAMALGVSKRTVEAWETGKNKPSGPSTKLLYLFDQDNKLVDHFLGR